MFKVCQKCHVEYATANWLQKYCHPCRARDRYLKVAKRFTDDEVIQFLREKGYHAEVSGDHAQRWHIVCAVPGDSQLYLIRHLSRVWGAHLVVRGDKDGSMKFIPTCYAMCLGCAKCRMAAELNGETAAVARERKRDPRSVIHIRKPKYGKKMYAKPLKTSCTPAEIDVHSQAEDID